MKTSGLFAEIFQRPCRTLVLAIVVVSLTECSSWAVCLCGPSFRDEFSYEDGETLIGKISGSGNPYIAVGDTNAFEPHTQSGKALIATGTGVITEIGVEKHDFFDTSRRSPPILNWYRHEKA